MRAAPRWLMSTARRNHRADLLSVETGACWHGMTELRRLREVEEENRRLRQLVADLTLDTQNLQETLRNNG